MTAILSDEIVPLDGAGERGISIWMGFVQRWADPVGQELPNNGFVLPDAKPGGDSIGTHAAITCVVNVCFLSAEPGAFWDQYTVTRSGDRHRRRKKRNRFRRANGFARTRAHLRKKGKKYVVNHIESIHSEVDCNMSKSSIYRKPGKGSLPMERMYVTVKR